MQINYVIMDKRSCKRGVYITLSHHAVIHDFALRSRHFYTARYHNACSLKFRFYANHANFIKPEVKRCSSCRAIKVYLHTVPFLETRGIQLS